MKYIQKNESPPTDFHKWLIDNAKLIEEKIQAYENGVIKRSEDVWSIFRTPEKMRHCDVKKGDMQHDIKPTQSDCQIKFGYSKRNGEVVAVESHKIQAEQAIEVLGLNVPPLQEKRIKILFKINAILRNIQKIAPAKLKEAVIKEKQSIYANPEKLPEMAFVAEYYWDSFLK